MKLMIVDGSNVLYRVMYTASSPSWDFYVFSFFRILITSLEKFNEPLHVIVGWDKGHPKKAEKYPDYKANRIKDEEPSPEIIAYRKAREFLHNELPVLGMASWLVTNYEADDMAMYATKIADNEGRLVSNDYDWLLAMTENTILYRPIKDEVITWNKFKEMMQHENPYEVYKWLKAITGDVSDNVPGVRGVGWKFGNKFARLLVDGKELPNSIKGKSVKESMDLVKRNYELFTLDAYDEKDIKIIERTFNEALNNREVLIQMKWLELCSKIHSDTLPLWYNRLKKNLKVV